MITSDERHGKILPAKTVDAHRGHVHHGHSHQEHSHHGHTHHDHAHGAHLHESAPRFSLIALSALQRLALVMPAIAAIGLLALWATQNG